MPGVWGGLARVQSHYVRRPADLPCAGRRVCLLRRFRCGKPGCQRQVFAERFGTTVLAERARRTGRLDDVVHHLGLALGGRPGAGSPNGSCCRSATTRCSASCVGASSLEPNHWPWSASTTGPTGAITATEPSSVTWSAAAWWPCCPIASRRRSRPGTRSRNRPPDPA